MTGGRVASVIVDFDIYSLNANELRTLELSIDRP
jgi:hypothetical protein